MVACPPVERRGIDNALDADIAEFKRRRDLVLELLERAARNGRVAAPPPPEGAFYVFCDVAPCLDLSVDGERVGTSTNFCKLLLKKRKLALVPGDAFGAPDGYADLGGDRELRAEEKREVELKRAFERIASNKIGVWHSKGLTPTDIKAL